MGAADGFQLLNEPARNTVRASGATSSKRTQRPRADVLTNRVVDETCGGGGSLIPQREFGKEGFVGEDTLAAEAA